MNPTSVVRFDTSPPLRVVLRYRDGTLLQDLDGAQVFFVMRDKEGNVKVSALADLQSATTGEVAYQWQEGDTDDEGLYDCQFRVRRLDGTDETVPSDGYFQVRVVPELARFVVRVPSGKITLRALPPQVITEVAGG